MAYEVTRQLQEYGQTVSSIVMLDSMDTKAFKTVTLSPKRDIFQAVNLALQAIVKYPEKMAEVLIHQNEVDSSLDDKAFFQQLVVLAEKRGLTKTKNNCGT